MGIEDRVSYRFNYISFQKTASADQVNFIN